MSSAKYIELTTPSKGVRVGPGPDARAAVPPASEGPNPVHRKHAVARRLMVLTAAEVRDPLKVAQETAARLAEEEAAEVEAQRLLDEQDGAASDRSDASVERRRLAAESKAAIQQMSGPASKMLLADWVNKWFSK
jgi:hypothetical protein